MNTKRFNFYSKQDTKLDENTIQWDTTEAITAENLQNSIFSTN